MATTCSTTPCRGFATPSSAEEAVQETFVAGLKAAEQYSGKGEERAWLLGILKRKIIDLVRRRNRSPALQSSDLDEG